MRNVAVAALAVVAAVSLSRAAPAHAAAYYVGEIGSTSLARGGANIVAPADPTAAWLNPAALSLAKGIQLDLDVNLVLLSSSFIRDCGGKVDGCAAPAAGVHKTYKGIDGSTEKYDVAGDRPPANDQAQPGHPDINALGDLGRPSRFDGKTPLLNTGPVQPIPRIMLSVNGDTFGVPGVGIGAYLYAPNNGHYTFGDDTPTRYSLIDRNLLEIYYGLAFAYRFGDVIGVGAGLQFVTAGLDQRIRLSADQYGNEDPDYDIGVHVTGQQNFIPSGDFGFWTNPGKLLGIGNLMIGGSMQLGRTVKATGPVTLDFIGPRFKSEFLDPKLVTLDVAKTATATAEFELAPFYRGGISYGIDDVAGDGKKTIGFDVEADVVYEAWSSYDHVFLATHGVTVNLSPSTPGSKGKELDPVVQPKDWDDSVSARLGGTLALWNKSLLVHAGGFYETSAIPNETYDIELVDGSKIGIGAGVTGKLWGCALTLAYSHVLVADRTVGSESIVYDGSSGPSILMGGADTRTRVAMGKYSAGFDMLDVSLNVGIDELFNFGHAHDDDAAAAH